MTDYHHASCIVLINSKGQFVLQQRDDKPGIMSPGKITTWGGASEPGETPLQAAVREIGEETNLRLAAGELEFFGDYLRDYAIDGLQVLNHVYLLRGIDEADLKVYEGQGYVVIDLSAATDEYKLTDLARKLIEDYRLRHAKS